jgi:hypothetical protein
MRGRKNTAVFQWWRYVRLYFGLANPIPVFCGDGNIIARFAGKLSLLKYI